MADSTAGSSPQTAAITLSRRALVFVGLGIAGMLLVWQVLSMLFSPVIIASPASTLKALWRFASDGELWAQFGNSLGRLLIGL